ncbi:response regulator receiver protein [Candidatus Koribacter versatilis Ellin345]|uniref:Response regulator receiver protein n=1 Tax=Koribacter versatilis (strain Ellin345) TaxID=204669 RepID=Q1IPN2_KORVE|nr:response regulator [Candidatus Koribacter versatilis]ABF41168.1 response regulator receiver protein [Candidatus Koribacter versatilis Ellin345]
MVSGSTSVLAVDDDRVHAYAMEKKLRASGFVVKCVHSGPEALAELRSGKYDAILLDINMPGLNGYQTCERIRSESSIPQPAIIFHSASDASEPAVHRAYDAGADAFLTYPVDDEQLKAVLIGSVAMRRSRSATELEQVTGCESIEAGDIVQVSGLYDVTHDGDHLPSGSIVLFAGIVLPPCRLCAVSYHLTRAIPHISEDDDFR